MPGSTRLRGITAAVILVGAIVGMPLTLAVTVGNPLHHWPSPSGGQLTDTGVIAVLATVFWLAWLSFVIPAAVEIALTVTAGLTRRPQRRIRLPFLGAQQDLARNLTSAVLLLLPAASTTLTATAAPVSHHATLRLNDATMSTEARRGPAPHHTVERQAHDPATRSYVIPDLGGLRSYWALAEHFLGDGTQWREIWRINQGRAHADGTVMDSPRQLHGGWTILIPGPGAHHEDSAPAPPHDATVAPGDTVSEIAAADGISDWQRVWTVNAGRAEPHGTRFTDPNLIRPGWTITLPDAPAYRRTPAAPSNGTRAPDPTESTRDDHPRPQRPRIKASHHGQQGGEESDVPPSAAADAPTAAPTDDTTPTAASRPALARDHGEHAEHRFPFVPLGIGLTAAASVAALDRARRIAQRRRRVGYRLLPPPAPLRDVEARIRRDARHAHPTTAAVSLAAALTGPQPVRVRTVIARRDGAVDLHLADPSPAPPPPFVQIAGGWRLPADDNAFAFGAGDPDGLDDPCPALIPVGATVDGQVLVNLAATGPVSVAGDPGDVEVFLRHTLTAVHAAPWAGRVQLHAPPYLAERLDPLERLTVEDSLRPQPPSEQPDDPAGAHGPEEPGWRTAPVHVFCGWAADADLAPLLHAAGNPSRDVHLLVIGAHLDTTRWTLDGDQLTIPGLAAPVTVTVAEPDDHDIAELLRHTTTAPDVPVDDPRLPETSGAAATDNASSDVRETRPDEAVIPRLRLLGPVELDGSGRLPRSQVLNLLALLALHPRGVDRHQLLAALWPDQVVNLQTMRNRIRETRRLVNGGITDGPIWRLTNAVTTDWDQFTALAAGDVDEQRRALDLVRGRPFSGLDDADWIDLGGFRSEVEAAIVDLALTVVEHDLATENYPGAQAAARAGLLASRYEERLHRAGISAALAQGLHGLAKTLQQEMRTALDLDIEPDDQIQPETLSLIRDLRDRRPAVSDTSQR